MQSSDQPEREWRRRYGYRGWRFSFLGLLLLLVGVWWLLGVRGLVTFNWDYVGPVVLILLGLWLVVRRLLWWNCYCCYYDDSAATQGVMVDAPKRA